ncbi:hypothetical protein GcM3_090017, partial [Golovinomyces cichoracearum]
NGRWIRVARDQDSGELFYNAPEPHQTESDQAPSWVASLISILTQFITNQRPTQSQIEVAENRPRNSQPHPEKFSGIDNSQYPQFRSLIEEKLRIDANAIGNEEERVWYGYGRLTDVSLRRIHPWIEFAKGKEQFTFAEFLDWLDKEFGDPEKITKAINKLNSIRQGNRSFREFLQDFEQTLLEAQAWEWTDDAKKGYLRTGLNMDLIDRLVSQVEPRRYDDFVSQLRIASDKLEALKAWDSRRERNCGTVAQSSYGLEPQEDVDHMDWEPTPSVNVSAAQRKFKGKMNHKPRARATCVSQEEIGRRISEGLCIRCGGQQHIIKGSSLLLPLNPNRHNWNQSQKSRIATSGVAEVGNNAGDLGKE